MVGTPHPLPVSKAEGEAFGVLWKGISSSSPVLVSRPGDIITVAAWTKAKVSSVQELPGSSCSRHGKIHIYVPYVSL